MFKVLLLPYIGRETMKMGKKSIKKYIFIICIVGVFLCSGMVPIAISACNKSTIGQTNYGGLPLSQPRTYYNATLFIISHTYYVRHFDEEKIDLGYRIPILPGIFMVETENGIQEFNLFGGWGGSRVEIYGFNGFLKSQGYYMVLIGNCTEIFIIPVREI